jgi:hypothetical protein
LGEGISKSKGVAQGWPTRIRPKEALWRWLISPVKNGEP